ncbi:fungal zn(2)-Cys(6) binuclear cluster domain-containing protein [Rhizoctonia solani AG-1 IA]|uniref:Fungal zn(2)-Cys(6) binuclear cluster domain-containing protein n=1 Tax=Thanatephorus cucumeris (strain AG1-IA) TaxID=983506 RepID=L8WY07_THACA|nr:fungal zn(2)-Cys(6) binuclear cluster domain-containing protein [Rhizoctonia solani AG-1 IA]
MANHGDLPIPYSKFSQHSNRVDPIYSGSHHSCLGRDAGGHSCKNCLERGKVCDRAEPICNLCIRDGLFCSGPDPPIRAPSPVFPSWEPPDLLRPFDRSLNSAPRVLRGAVSAIVSTPSWGASNNSPRYSSRKSSLSTLSLTKSRTLALDRQIENVRFVDKIAFKMPPPELREGIILRLRSSVITFSVMSLGARIIQALIDNFDDTNWTVYSNLTDRLYSHICAVSNNADDQSHIEGRLAGTIDLAGFKFMTSNNAAGYELIQKATPTLLRLAYRHPEIWTKSGLISISQVMSCAKYEIFNFIWMDNIVAMVLGTSTFLPYDITGQASHSRFQMEWIWGCPQEFVIQCARINKLRFSAGGQSGLNQWKGIERELMEWEPVSESTNDSRDVVAICGVNSADPRVNSSANQITRLVGTVGTCARQESQRGLVEEKLSSMRATKMWVLRSSDFTAVLEHLWHGAAKNGRATTWNDYTRSRRAVLPVAEGQTPELQ